METVLPYSRVVADLSAVSPISVSLDTENELDFSLKEKTTEGMTYTLTQEENLISELTRSFFGQDHTSGIDLEHLSKETRDEVRRISTPFLEMWNGNLGEVKSTEHGATLVKGGRAFRSQLYRVGPRARQVEHESVSNVLNTKVIVPS